MIGEEGDLKAVVGLDVEVVEGVDDAAAKVAGAHDHVRAIALGHDVVFTEDKVGLAVGIATIVIGHLMEGLVLALDSRRCKEQTAGKEQTEEIHRNRVKTD